MTLKKQMLALAGLLLALPLSTLLLFGTLERTWQHAAEQSLRELSRQAAWSLRDYYPTQDSAAIFLPPHSDSPIILDAYDNDWQEVGLPTSVPDHFRRFTEASAMALLNGNTLYLYLSIPNPDWTFWQPDQETPDHDRLLFYGELPEPSVLAAQAPGQATFFHHGTLLADSYWAQQGGRLVIELQIPAAQLSDRFALCWQDSSHPRTTDSCLIGTPANPVRIYRMPANSLEALTALSPSNSKLILSDPQARDFLSFDNDPGQDLEDRWTLSQLVTGRLASLFSKPDNDNGISWLHREDIRQTSLRLRTPVTADNGTLLGFLTMERRLSGLSSQASAALANSLTTTFIIILVILGILLLYGVWLSSRIRKLRDGLSSSLDARTRYQHPFSVSTQPDEIGDLSRTFGHLLEELRAYASYKETFVSKLTHECRTPISIISSSLQLAAHCETDAERQHYLQRAEQGCNRLSQLIKAMGESTRLEKLMLQFEKENFAISELLSAAAANYSSLLTAHRFSSAIPTSTACLCGSPDLLIQALDKLIENARDFTPQGQQIHLSMRLQPTTVTISVDNEGPPLPAGYESQLFAPYQSHRPADSSHSQDLHLGLGLTMVNLIARFHEGSVAIVNTGQGVSVSMTLPILAHHDIAPGLS